jgi:EutQ-like cupin domain
VGRATFQPGWQWSKHGKPIAQTESCQAAHTGYFVSGRMVVRMDDGEEMAYGPGDFATMAPWTRRLGRGRGTLCGDRLAGFRRLRQEAASAAVTSGTIPLWEQVKA